MTGPRKLELDGKLNSSSVGVANSMLTVRGAAVAEIEQTDDGMRVRRAEAGHKALDIESCV